MSPIASTSSRSVAYTALVNLMSMLNIQKASSSRQNAAKTQSRMISWTDCWLLEKQTLYYTSTGQCQIRFHSCLYPPTSQLGNSIKISLCCSSRWQQLLLGAITNARCLWMPSIDRSLPTVPSYARAGIWGLFKACWYTSRGKLATQYLDHRTHHLRYHFVFSHRTQYVTFSDRIVLTDTSDKSSFYIISSSAFRWMLDCIVTSSLYSFSMSRSLSR